MVYHAFYVAPECPVGMIFKQCGSMCPQTCENDGNTICSTECVEGCFCDFGTVLNSDGNCIAPSECPSKHIDITI